MVKINDNKKNGREGAFSFLISEVNYFQASTVAMQLFALMRSTKVLNMGNWQIGKLAEYPIK